MNLFRASVGVLLAVLLSASFVGAAFGAGAAQPPQQSSANVPWAFQNQNQQNTGFSPETKINANNVGSLVPAWTSVNITNIAGTPVVSGDLAYLAGPPSIYAVNIKSGAIVWEDGPTVGLTQLDFRTAAGMTVTGRTVYTTTRANQLLALNAKNGALKWEVPINSTLTGDLYPYLGAEATPLVWGGIIVVGETSGDVGPTRGVIQGFNQTNGAHLWTFYITPPGPINSTNQAAWGNTWGTNGTSGCICGGGAQWNVPSIDPNTGIIYFGTGNPYPSNNPFVRQPKSSDKNLYTECIIAINIRTGKLDWYFQEVFPTYLDWDQGMPTMLYNTTISGVKTQVVGVGGKAGYFFELNSKTGALIFNDSLGIHLNDDVPSKDVPKTGILIYPGPDGGINTFSSFNPVTNMVYSVAANIPAICHRGGDNIGCPDDDSIAPNSTLYAISASTGKVEWSINLAYIGGGVSSADNVVYFADGNHNFYAANALTGAILWTYHDPSGDNGLFSWGPPSIVDGYVLWETYGLGSTPGHLIAFRLSQASPGGPTSSGAGLFQVPPALGAASSVFMAEALRLVPGLVKFLL